MVLSVFYLEERIENIFLYVFLFCTSLVGQNIDTSITIDHFKNQNIIDFPVVFDESGENTFLLDKHHPFIINDYSINHIKVDGSLHLPQGSYFLPQLIPIDSFRDSIRNFSQIHYRKGDYKTGELGLSLQIESKDSSFFDIHGFRRTPPIYSLVSWDDNLQNYLVSYKRLSQSRSMSVDAMYHLEDYHLPLLSGEYRRQVESFHGGVNYQIKWEKLGFEYSPAFQMTHVSRQGLAASFLSLWNNANFIFSLGNNFNLYLQNDYKMIMAEQNSEESEIDVHLIRPKVNYQFGGISLECGVAIHKRLLEPEGKFVWKKNNLYLSAGREYNIIIEPVEIAKFKKYNYHITSISSGYIGDAINILFDIFQIESSNKKQSGFNEKVEINLPWVTLSQKIGIYADDRNIRGPVQMFNNISILFSPNTWFWSTDRYQPFIEFESTYIQYSGDIGINPTQVPIFEINQNLDSFNSHIINMEFGILVERFKVSYRVVQPITFENSTSNSVVTVPLQSIQQLAIVWQFLN